MTDGWSMSDAAHLLYNVPLVKLLRSEAGFVLDKLEGVPVHSL